MAKAKDKQAQKFVDAITLKMQKEFEAARIEAVLYGVGILVLTSEGDFRHLPMEAIQKGDVFGKAKSL